MADAAVDSGSYTPETIARRRKVAEQLLGDSMSQQPIHHWAQGLAQLARAGIGGYMGYQANEDEKSSRTAAIAQALAAFGGGGGAGAPASLAPPAAGADAAPTGGPAMASAPPPVPYGANPVTANDGQSFPMPPSNPLNGLNPEFRGKFADIRSAAADQGVNFDAPTGGLGGIRTPEQQAAIYAQGRTAPGPVVTGTLNSNHIGGKAFDVVPTDGTTPKAIGDVVSALTKNDPRFAGVRSGATFSNLYDPLHVELNAPQGQRLAGPVPTPDSAPVPQGVGGPVPPQMAGGPPAPPQGGQPQPGPVAPAGAPPNSRAAIAALLNPWTPPALQSALAGQINPTYGFQTLPDGTIIRTDPRHGTVQPIYQAPTKSTFGVIGENRDGQKIYGMINPEKGTATPVQVPGTASAPGAQDVSGATGDEYLKSLNDPGRADLIKGMVEGRMAPAQMGRYGTQAVQSLLKDAARYEPGFDMTKWNARTGTAKDFASGAAAKQVTSLNTVIGHMGDLAEKADALGNTSFPLVNSVKNTVNQATGNPEVTNFNLARNAVADEMAKVFRGGGLSDSETRQWKENIGSANSPEQLKGAVKTGIGLMESRLNALNEQRNKGMGTQTEPAALLTDKSRATLDKVRSWADGNAPAKETAPAAAPPPPKPGTTMDGYRFKGGDPAKKENWEQVL